MGSANAIDCLMIDVAVFVSLEVEVCLKRIYIPLGIDLPTKPPTSANGSLFDSKMRMLKVHPLKGMDHLLISIFLEEVSKVKLEVNSWECT